MSFSQRSSKRPYMVAVLSLAALLLSAWLSAAAFARSVDSPAAAPNAVPAAQDARAYLTPQAGAPANHGTVSVGTKFTLDLKIHPGTNTNIAAAQNYLLFD